jgi:hypothetical protein
MGFLSTVSLFNAIKGDLESRRYTQSSPGLAAALSTGPDDKKLFQRVIAHAGKNPEATLEEMRLMENRIAIIAPAGDEHKRQKLGRSTTAERSTDFVVLIMDKNFSASRGTIAGTAESPGLLNLKDLTVAALTQQSYDVDGLVCAIEPDHGAPVTLEWKEKGASENTGREAWGQLFHIESAGVISIQAGRRR